MARMIQRDQSVEQPQRCDFCGYAVLGDVVVGDSDQAHAFCSQSCLDAFQENETTLKDHSYKRVPTGVGVLDGLLPEGIYANSFVLLSGDEGTRARELHVEMAWRALQRGEPVVFVSFRDPPVTVVERFLAHGWNVLPHLEAENLLIIDCLTHRLEDRDQFYRRQNGWNEHLASVAEDVVCDIRDPSDTRELGNQLDNALEDMGMTETGIVLVDSLSELETLIQNPQVHSFLTDVRADVCKSRFVPLFANASAGETGEFPHNHGHVFDGIVDMRLNTETFDGMRIKEAGIRKMDGVPYHPQWVAYESVNGRGLVPFDPTTEMQTVYGTSDQTTM